MLANKKKAIRFLRQPSTKKVPITVQSVLAHLCCLTVIALGLAALLNHHIYLLHEVKEDYHTIKTYVINEKHKLAQKAKKLALKEAAAHKKRIKLLLLHYIPLKLIHTIIKAMPPHIRLEQLTFIAKERLDLKGRARRSPTIAYFLETLQKNIYVPPCSLTAGGYKQHSQDYFYHITIRL